jgi:peptidylprolyl isomerase
MIATCRERTNILRRISLIALTVAAVAGSTLAASSATAAQKEKKKMTKTESGLQYTDLKEGKGESPKKGQTCVVHYTGWLWENDKKGTKFDSSVDRGEPFDFRVGLGQVIKGWDEGVSTMKPGGKRALLIPAKLGYGDRGAGNAIPPGATLYFEVELLEVQ